ncbi:hypothetical protein Tco_0765868 [Tanacetum coccineum]
MIAINVSSSNAKFPYLKKDEYETWAMKMEYWIMNSDHNLWNIVLHGNSRKRTGRYPRGNMIRKDNKDKSEQNQSKPTKKRKRQVQE